MIYITGIWWALIVLVVFHHIGYPMVLKIFARRVKQTPIEQWPHDPELWPHLTLVVPCFNERDVIVQKLHNVSFLDYPKERLHVLLIDDGSSDDTVSLIEQTLLQAEFTALSIELKKQSQNKGKVAALNWALSQVTNGLIVLSDASALISIDALKRAARTLNDETVGVVCASYSFLNEGSEGEVRYWRYQTQLKALESNMGSTVGAHGALYAFRADAIDSLPSDTINDDFILPMTIVRKGQRCVYDQEMIAVELEQATSSQDFSRRQRIAAGNLQQALRLVGLLRPQHGWVAFNFFSGKWLRVFMPFILVFVWLISAWNPQGVIMLSIAFWAQNITYVFAIICEVFPDKRWPKMVKLLHYLIFGYIASGVGVMHYLVQPKHFSAWQRAGSKKSQSYLSRRALMSKRLFDVCVACSGLLLTLPFWPMIAIAIKIESKGPILFRQMRIGRALPDRTELFQMLKFRTMSADAEAETGAVWASSNDPRVTRLGKFMRKTRIDELPQLLNVLRGDMSLVGPRPERPGIGRDLDRAIPYYAERTFFVTPGITGLAQVNQGYDTCLDDVKTKLLYDHAYALALSSSIAWLRMDLYIAFKTVWVMVAGRGQ
jgi:lipopolysaccharide/colanic/teichoic acid biosynthesis glycosyltransferase